MLREIKNSYVGPRLFRVAITTTATPSITAGVGADDYTSLTRASAGRFSAALKQPYRRTPITVAALESASLFGACTFQKVTPTVSTLDFQMANAGSSAIDATINAFQLGYTANQLGFSFPQGVESSIRRSRIIYARVSSTGTVDFGSRDFTVSKSATGVYNISFKNAFAATPIILPQAIATSGAISATVRSRTASGCQIGTGNSSAAAADSAFYIIAIGTDCRDAHGGASAIIENSQRKPRIIGFRVTAGSLAVNAEEVSSITINAGNDFTINLARPFRRECAAIFSTLLTGGNAMKATVHTGGSSSVRIQLTDTGGGAASSIDGYDGILIGSDDPSEY